jgi:hypothetical protein
MSNPDTSNAGPNVDSLLTAFPVAILFFLITTVLFQFRDSFTSFKLMLWLTIPILAFIITSAVNVTSQYVNCKKTNVGKAMLGALPSFGAVILGMGISSLTFCRIPVTSVFAPLLIGKSVDVTKNKSTTTINSLKNSNSKECCVPKLTLESIENQYPLIAGISYGFYIMFSILFGMVIGNGLSSIC